MEGKVQFSSVDLKFYIHATEDQEKVLNTVSTQLLIPRNQFDISGTEGHFGNPIIVCSAKLLHERAGSFVEHLFLTMENSLRITLLEQIEQHVNEYGELFLRVDKQKLLEGKIAEGQVDAVRIRLRPKDRTPRHQLVETYHSILDQALRLHHKA